MKGLNLILYYLAMLGLTLPAIIYAQRLFRRYRQRYLLTFLYYLIATTLYAFLVYFTPDLINMLFKNPALRREGTLIYGMTSFIAFPLFALYFFLIARFYAELCGRELTRSFRRIFFSAVAVVAVVYCFGLKLAIDSGSGDFINAWYLNYIRPAGILFRLGISLAALLSLKTIADVVFRRVAGWIIWYYLIGFSAHYILRYVPQSPAVFYSRPIYFLMLNIPPLIMLGSFLKRHTLPDSTSVYTPDMLAQLCDQYRISKREREILLLLLQGLSNKEIEERLYISLGTVKTHVYTIFQKFNVETRPKLINWVNDRLRRQ